jgi:uncharacterized protein (TIGR00251 family)
VACSEKPKPWAIRATEAGVAFSVRVQPRANRNEIVGIQGDALKVRLAAPPVEGAANEALLSYLSTRLGVGQRQVRIVTGHSARMKIVEVTGLTVDVVQARLLSSQEPGGSKRRFNR